MKSQCKWLVNFYRVYGKFVFQLIVFFCQVLFLILLCSLSFLVPKYPPLLNTSTINSTEAIIIWDVLPAFVWTGIPLRYELTLVENLRNGTVRTSELFILAPDETMLLVNGLIPYTNCSVYITACTSIGCCSPNKVDFLTRESGKKLYYMLLNF